MAIINGDAKIREAGDRLKPSDASGRLQIQELVEFYVPMNPEFFTYLSSNSITVDMVDAATDSFQLGDKVKIKQTTDKEFYIVDVTGSVLTLTPVVSGTTVANAAITEIAFSRLTAPVEFLFSTFAESTNQSTTETVGFVSFLDSGAADQNKVVKLDFTKPDNLKLLKVSLRTRFYDVFNPINGALIRLDSASAFLNPGKTNTTGSLGFHYWRYSGGTSLFSAHSASSDEEELVTDFTQAQIDDIDDGYNEIVLQSDNNDASEVGLVTLNLILLGVIDGFALS